MTRINIVPVAQLCDQHLLAEFRELTRIPRAVIKAPPDLSNMPSDYTLGKGHARFFYNKLAFLKKRYRALHIECVRRGFNVHAIWPEGATKELAPDLWGDYKPTVNALMINMARIKERWPKNARYNREPHTTRRPII